MNLIEKITNEKWFSPETGEALGLSGIKIVIDSDVIKNIEGMINEFGFGHKIAVVSDTNTYDVLAAKIEKTLDKFEINSVILSGNVHADMETANKIIENTKLSDVIIAVGSGTINDLCKYASFKSDKPYIIFGTAPSMNGYMSANASITVAGHKKTLPAHLPSGVFLDLDILSAAPPRLIKSGLGDCLCRSTAQADWLLSHLLLGTNYLSEPFDFLSECESELFANSTGLLSGDKEAVKLLTQTLILSGIGMYISGGSYPASQGEHMIAHTMEMAYKDKLPLTYHGEQIGVTTLYMASLQQKFLNKTPVINNTIDNAALIDFFGEEIADNCIKEYSAKIFSAEMLDELNHYIERNWQNVAARISEISVESDKLEKILLNISAPTTPNDLGWSESDYNKAIKYAKFTRDRFTFLDFL